MLTIKQIYAGFALTAATFLIGCSNGANEAETSKSESLSNSSESASSKLDIDPQLVAGKRVFSRCKACHTLNEGGRHRVGPNMWGIFGQKAGTQEGFNYSKAMAASDIVWTDETMAAFLESPRTYLPNNKMTYVGLAKQKDRDDLIAYLRAETGANR